MHFEKKKYVTTFKVKVILLGQRSNWRFYGKISTKAVIPFVVKSPFDSSVDINVNNIFKKGILKYVVSILAILALRIYFEAFMLLKM